MLHADFVHMDVRCSNKTLENFPASACVWGAIVKRLQSG